MIDSKRILVIVAVLLAFARPVDLGAQGRGWRWFQTCPSSKTLVFEVRLDTTSLVQTTSSLCLLPAGTPWPRTSISFPLKSARAIAWAGYGPTVVTTPAGRPLEGNVWQAGIDTSHLFLSVIVKGRDTARMRDTIFMLREHIAKLDDRIETKLADGLTLVTYPVGWQPKPVVVRTRPRHNRPPPTPWIAAGECPGEYCTLGAWTACSTLVAVKDKRRGAPPVFTLRRGDRFTAVTGDVHVEIPGLVVFRDTATYVPAPWAGSQDTVRFRKTDTLYLLNELSEGFLVWWLNGQPDTGQEMWWNDPDEPIDPNQKGPAVLIRRTTSNWWVRVRNAAGAEGWILPSYRTVATGSTMDSPERCNR